LPSSPEQAVAWAAQSPSRTERPRPVLILPPLAGWQLRLLDLFPRLMARLLPLALCDARRKQRRYKKLIQAGKWPTR
jgi:hypothetical protein